MHGSYEWAAEKLAGARSEEAGKPLGNNTRLFRRGDDYAIRLHATDIVTIHPDDSVTLNTGGWKTSTTKARINEYAPGRVYSDRGVWYVYRNGQKIAPFADGITLHPDGSVTGAGEDTARETARLKKKVAAYARAYVDALYAGRVEAPSGGDCWFCCLRDTAGRPMGDHSSDHLLSHIEENYYVPSLVWNALNELGGSIAAKQSVSELQTGGATSWGGIVKDQITRTLRRYMLRQLGVGA